MTYESDRVERSLRAAVQHQAGGWANLFLGSRKHLIERLFTDQRRALYRSAGALPPRPYCYRALDAVHP